MGSVAHCCGYLQSLIFALKNRSCFVYLHQLIFLSPCCLKEDLPFADILLNIYRFLWNTWKLWLPHHHMCRILLKNCLHPWVSQNFILWFEVNTLTVAQQFCPVLHMHLYAMCHVQDLWMFLLIKASELSSDIYSKF